MAAAVLHAQQFVLALVELMVANRRGLKAHQRQRFDRRLVMKERGEQRTGADQVAGRDEDRVSVCALQLLDQGGHGLRSAGGDRNQLGGIIGVTDLDAAIGRLKIAMKVIDRQDRNIQRDAHALRHGCSRAEEDEVGRHGEKRERIHDRALDALVSTGEHWPQTWAGPRPRVPSAV